MRPDLCPTEVSMPGFDAQITFCCTPDLAGTARFYEEIMGLPLALDQGTCRIYRVAGRAFLGFCQKPDGPPLGRQSPGRLLPV